jgi:thiamine-phosphate pyrophosphorylase
MFGSATKPDATRAEIATVKSARGRISLPIVAIGGITPENGATLLEAGADLLAVIRGVFGHDDPAESARQYATLFTARAQDEET